MDMGRGWYASRTLKGQNLGRGVASPKAGECQYCGAWHSELPKSGYCPGTNCAQRHTAELILQGKTMLPEKDTDGQLLGVWLKDTDGVVRFKKMGV
jgi:hypothetical protein